VNVRHDAPIEVVIKAGRRMLSREVVRADLVDAHLAVQAFMRGGVSGYVNWHDERGNPLTQAPKVSLRLTDMSFQLRDGELCTCDRCQEEGT
jgi:hypothetical protein